MNESQSQSLRVKKEENAEGNIKQRKEDEIKVNLAKPN